MSRFGDMTGDPTEYNPDKSKGEEGTENVPEPDNAVLTETLLSTDKGIQWNGSDMWFDCPFCGDRLCSKWFLSGGNCSECGSKVNIKIEVKQVKHD